MELKEAITVIKEDFEDRFSGDKKDKIRIAYQFALSILSKIDKLSGGGIVPEKKVFESTLPPPDNTIAAMKEIEVWNAYRSETLLRLTGRLEGVLAIKMIAWVIANTHKYKGLTAEWHETFKGIYKDLSQAIIKSIGEKE